jgi:hypothetical protein
MSAPRPCARSAARGATAVPRSLTILVGGGDSALQPPRPEMASGADEPVLPPANSLPRRRTRLRARRSWAPAGTPVGGRAATGGRARFPYLPRAAATDFLGKSRGARPAESV